MLGADDAFDARLTDVLRSTRTMSDPMQRLARIVAEGLDRLPRPASGRTLARWRALAHVAHEDLSLAKLYEGHTDALAICSELGTSVEPQVGPSAVWAAEAPGGRLSIDRIVGKDAVLRGRKNWCSGARGAAYALATAWHPDGGGPQLVRFSLDQPGIQVDSNQWQAVGMAASESLDVHFEQVSASLVGSVGDYLRRPGFWQGGAGVAACWFGGARYLQATLDASLQQTQPDRRGAAKLAALGKVDVLMAGAAAMLREGAQWVDDHPTADARAAALRLRLGVEEAASAVLREVGRAMGATPFCRDVRFARAAADLPVFLRQSHGERDFEALGALLLHEE